MTSITFGCVVEISNYSSQWELQTTKHNWRGSGIETPCLKVDEVGWFWDNHSFHARFSYGKRAVGHLEQNLGMGFSYEMIPVRQTFIPPSLHNIYKHHQTSTKQHVEIIQHLQNKTYMASSRFSTLNSSTIYLQQQKRFEPIQNPLNNQWKWKSSLNELIPMNIK